MADTENTVTWVPQNIKTISRFRKGTTPTAAELNDLFNLLISQGNWNSDALDDIYNSDLLVELATKAVQDFVDSVNEAIAAGALTGPQGLQGNTGPKGDTGPTGAPGAPGADGASGILIDNPTDYILYVEDGYLKCMYNDGATEPDFTINENGELCINFNTTEVTE